MTEQMYLQQQLQLIQKQAEKNIDEIFLQAKQKIPNIISGIKRDIYDTFYNISLTTLKKYFSKYYGNDYDDIVLEKSFSIQMTGNLKPVFSYNEKAPVLKSQLKYKTPFNQNADVYRDNRTGGMSIDDVDAFEYGLIDNFFLEEQDTGMDFSGFEEEETEEYANALHLRDFKPINEFERTNCFIETKKVFELAKIEIYREFNSQYNISIKPKIVKKYGIKL